MMDNPEGNETWKDFSRQAAFAISKHPNGDFDETVAFYLDNGDLHDDYMVSYQLNIKFQSYSNNIPLYRLHINSTNNTIYLLEV